MKIILFAFIIFLAFTARAQQLDSIFVNLYTDSLKKGTYNYINVEGLYSSGNYLPLDSNDIIFSSSFGKFFGNSLWIDSNMIAGKVKIKVVARKNHLLCREFVMHIKKTEESEILLTNEEYLEKLRNRKKKKDKNS
ncbi:MAG: hypothetical protein WKF35_05440 [Ferruginibacter sp.]